jgi:hypothetical protein
MSYQEMFYTHFASSINNNENIILEMVNSVDIFKHAELFKYNIYKLTNRHIENDENYGVLYIDYKNYWTVPYSGSIIEAITYGDNTTDTFVVISDDLLKYYKTIIPTNIQINIYFTQRLLWNDEQDIRDRPTKRIEFETAYKLFLGLAHRMIIKHQVNFLNYYVDILFELRDSIDYNVPSICIEIDENNHIDRIPEQEVARQNVIEYFNNIIYRIPVMKTDTDVIINTKVNDIIKQVIDKADDLLIIYNPDLSKHELEQELLKNNFAAHIIDRFLDNHDTGDKEFCMRHDTTAKYLGYGDTKNYRLFKQLIINKNSIFKINIDYKIIKKIDINNACVGQQTLTQDSLGRHNYGGISKEIVIIFPRNTFHRLCILSSKPKARDIAMSFSAMYEITLKYIAKTRTAVIEKSRSCLVLEVDVKQRVNALVEQRSKKLNTKIQELDNENNELNNIITKLNIDIDKLTNEKDNLIIHINEIKEIHAENNNLTQEQINIIKNYNITKLKKLGKIASIPNYSKYRIHNKDELTNKIIEVCMNNNTIATKII